MADAVLLRVDAFSCERDGRRLFHELTFDLGGGECLELRGPNGSGKSTLIRAVAGLYPDFAGTIEAVESLYLGHRLGISGLLTAEENLRWYAALAGAGAPGGAGTPGGAGAGSDGIGRVLEQVGMAGFERVRCQQMSAGQQRRVGLARLLLAHTPLWLLDEPLTALDQAGQSLVRELIEAQCSGGGAVLCATHQPLGLPAAGVLSLEADDATMQDPPR